MSHPSSLDAVGQKTKEAAIAFYKRHETAIHRFIKPIEIEIGEARGKPDTHHPYHPAVVNRSMAAAAPAHECVRHVALAGTQETTCLAKISSRDA